LKQGSCRSYSVICTTAFGAILVASLSSALFNDRGLQLEFLKANSR